jgi:hypothetical protein
MDSSPCKACGRNIWWGQTKQGGRIPLSKVSTVYTEQDGVAHPIAASQLYISHFVDCTDPARFSKGKKGGGG